VTPKERRDRIFKKDRPLIRPLKIIEGDQYGKDMGVLWVAHKKIPFEWLKVNTQQEFSEEIQKISKGEDLMVSEDRNRSFKSGKGIVGLISISTNGWKLEPHVQFMPWATKRNILRTTVAFLQYIRLSRKVGVCMVLSLENSVKLFNTVCTYGVLNKVGKIVNGDPRGDEYVYSVSGKRKLKPCH